MTLVRDLLLQFAATEDALVIPRKTRATEQLTDWTSASALLSFATSFLNFVGGDDFTWDLEYFLFCRRVVYMQSCLHVRLLFFHRFFLKISCMKQIHHHLLQCLTALRAGIPCLAVFCMVACGRKYFGAAGVLCCVLENTIPCHPPVNCVWTVEILPEIFLLKQKNFWKVNSSLGCQGILNRETQILQKPKKHQGMEMPKLGSLSFSLEPFYFFFFCIWVLRHGSRFPFSSSVTDSSLCDTGTLQPSVIWRAWSLPCHFWISCFFGNQFLSIWWNFLCYN